MPFPTVSLAAWRAQVEQELAGKPFEKALVTETPEGIAVQPLYTAAPGSSAAREPSTQPFRICIRCGDEPTDAMIAEVNDGADALWAPLDALQLELMREPAMAKIFFVFDGALPGAAQLEQLVAQAAKSGAPQFSLGLDPLDPKHTGAALGAVAKALLARAPGSRALTVSTLPFHEAGADSAFELACALSASAHAFRLLMEQGLSAEQAASQISLRVAAGRDTFLELCKLRALRTCWRKLVSALGAPLAPRAQVHAVCSARTLSERDPWVNMLRVTTQMFAAILGGADLVTPNEFDLALGERSALGRRVARNTGLVLRDESLLGKVCDPAGGSYALESLTDAVARKAWAQFRALEQEGGIAQALASGALAKKLEAAWQQRLEAIRKRKIPILGVSEFANLDETLPHPAHAHEAERASDGAQLASHRDAAPFESLRAQAESRATAPSAALVTIGPFAESRARAGFAQSFFAAGGIRSRETSELVGVPIACLCGSDERYATEAAPAIRALKAAGCGQVLVAGRPGALEQELREAGADGFIFVGCDAVAVLETLLARAP